MQVLPLHARRALLPPAESALPRAYGCTLLSATWRTVSTSLFMTNGAEFLHAFPLWFSCSAAYAYTLPRGFGSKAEYRLLATLCRARPLTALYYLLHRTGAPSYSIIPHLSHFCNLLERILYCLSKETAIFPTG